jgi:hypothetical protein
MACGVRRRAAAGLQQVFLAIKERLAETLLEPKA